MDWSVTLPGSVEARAKGKTEEKDTPRAKARRATGKRDGGKFGGYIGGASGESKGRGYQGHCWTRVENWTQVRDVNRESPAFTRMMHIAEEVEVNLSQKETEKSEVCGSLETWRNSRRRKEAPAARCADPSSGHMKINAMS